VSKLVALAKTMHGLRQQRPEPNNVQANISLSARDVAMLDFLADELALGKRSAALRYLTRNVLEEVLEEVFPDRELIEEGGEWKVVERPEVKKW
jgi:hypothetical protein